MVKSVDHFLKNKSGWIFSDQMRILFKGVIDPIAAFFNGLGISPNAMTIIGLCGNAIGAVFIAFGWVTVGGIIILFTAPLDALDGSMARLRGQARTDSSPSFGAFFDSVIDRYAELLLFGGLVIYYTQLGQWLGVALAYASAAGSMLVSYTRARAQSLGIETKIGILSRLERYIILVPTLIFNIPLVGLSILAIFANITAIQRIVDVYRQMQARALSESSEHSSL